jgi:serralysin
LYLSADTVLDEDDIYLSYDSVGELAAEEEETGTVSVTLPAELPDGPGTYYILAVADQSERVAESNENNNISMMSSNNHAPQAYDDTYQIDKNTALVVDGRNYTSIIENDVDPDGDSLVVQQTPVSDVDHGILQLFSDGTFIYTADTDFTGTDTFQYAILDSRNVTSTAEVTITIQDSTENGTLSTSHHLLEELSYDQNADDANLAGDYLSAMLSSDGSSYEQWNIPDDGILTYSFVEQRTTQSQDAGETTTLTFIDEVKNGVRNAFDLYESFLPITFIEEKNTPDNANFKFFYIEKDYMENYADAPAFARGPGHGTIENDADLLNDLGIVVLSDNMNFGIESLGFDEGDFGFVTILHELGHLLGLEHPHYDGGSDLFFPGAEEEKSPGDFGLAGPAYTLMSYTYDNEDLINEFGMPISYMALDIAALQFLYGANMSYHDGATTYELDPEAEGIYTIWDTGGIDVIELVNDNIIDSTSAIIDLRAASIDTDDLNAVVDSSGFGGYISSFPDEYLLEDFGDDYPLEQLFDFISLFFNESLNNGLTIAPGVVIENAIGGDAADILIGNEVANELSGRKGDDTLFGGDDDDTLDGGDGDDTLGGGSGNDIYKYYRDGGTDTIEEADSEDNSSNDVLEIWDNSSTIDLDDFDDLRFMRIDNDLVINLDIEGDFFQDHNSGQIIIKNQGSSSSAVEWLEIYDNDGQLIHGQIDLVSAWAAAKSDFTTLNFVGSDTDGYYAVSQGKVTDGPISGAEIYIDANNNGTPDSAESIGIFTDEQGCFSLEEIDSDYNLMAVGGINIDTGLSNTLVFSAPSGSSMITPITTLITTYVDSNAVSKAEAEEAVQAALGLEMDIDFFQYDPFSQPDDDSTALAVQKAAAQVATLGTLAEQAGTSFSAVIVDLANAIADGTTLDLDSQSYLSTIIGTTLDSGIIEKAAQINGEIENASTIDDIAAIQQENFQSGDDYTNTTATTGYVLVNNHTTGNIEELLDEDWFAVSLIGGETYQIDLEGIDTLSGSLSDPYLAGIYDSAGKVISGTSDLNGGTGLNSQLHFTPDDTGTYYIAAGGEFSFSVEDGLGFATGTYTLSVSLSGSDTSPMETFYGIFTDDTSFPFIVPAHTHAIVYDAVGTHDVGVSAGSQLDFTGNCGGNNIYFNLDADNYQVERVGGTQIEIREQNNNTLATLSAKLNADNLIFADGSVTIGISDGKIKLGEQELSGAQTPQIDVAWQTSAQAFSGIPDSVTVEPECINLYSYLTNTETGQSLNLRGGTSAMIYDAIGPHIINLDIYSSLEFLNSSGNNQIQFSGSTNDYQMSNIGGTQMLIEHIDTGSRVLLNAELQGEMLVFSDHSVELAISDEQIQIDDISITGIHMVNIGDILV